MAYATGFASVAESIEESKAKRNSGFSKTNYFKLADKESAIIRFVSEDVISVPVFPIQPTEVKDENGNVVLDDKGKPVMTSKYPQDVVDSEFLDGDKARDNIVKTHEAFMKVSQKGKKYHPSAKKIALGVVVKRKELNKIIDGQPQTEYEDLLEDFEDENGKKIQKVVPYLINASQSTFWEGLTTIARRNGLTKFDIEVSRSGAGLDTKYHFAIIPEGITDAERAKWKEAGDANGVGYYKELFGEDLPDLEAWIEFRGSVETYEKYVYPHLPGFRAKPKADNDSESSEEEVEATPDDSDTVRKAPAVGDLAAQLRAAGVGK